MSKEGGPSLTRRKFLIRTAAIGFGTGLGTIAGVGLAGLFTKRRGPEPGKPHSTTPLATETHEVPGSPLVTVENGQFYRNGKKFGLFGTDNYALMTSPSYIAYSSPVMTDEDRASYMKDIRSKGMNVVRCWAFPVLDRNGQDLSAFDTILHLAGQDIVVYPTFENEWPNSDGMTHVKSTEWYKQGYKVTYRPYVLLMAERYKGDPRIFAFQLINEAQCDDPEALYEFTKDMVRSIKAIDRDRLVTLGTIGSGQPGTAGEYYARLMKLCDFGDVHLYANNGTAGALSSDFATLARQNKPLIIGEWGIPVSQPDIASNAEIMKYALTQPNFGGVIVWEYEDSAYNRGSNDDGFQETAGSPALSFFQSYADKLKTPDLRN